MVAVVVFNSACNSKFRDQTDADNNNDDEDDDIDNGNRVAK